MPARVVYVARNNGTDTRVSKECNSLMQAGYEVHFVGWRAPSPSDFPDPMPAVPKHFYIAPRGAGKLGKLIRLFGFARYVVYTLHMLRPHVVHAVNEELGLLIVLLQRRFGFRSVCDVFDSIELTWGHKPFPINTAVQGMARLVHAQSDVLLVTDETRRIRLGPNASKARIVSNFPVDVGAALASALPDPTGPVRLYVAGSLMVPRGLESVLRLLEKRSDVKVVSAGWLYDDLAEAFVRHPAVDYRGVVTPEESLRLAASCHAILALYEPCNQNNVLASPNKIYDALCVGRPVIINRTARISHWVEEQGIGYVVTYDALDELEAVVDVLKAHWGSMGVVARRLRSLYEKGYSWEVAERELLAAYEALCVEGRIAEAEPYERHGATVGTA